MAKQINFKEIPTPGIRGKQYGTKSGLVVIVEQHNERWHLSISHKSRLPSYKELKEARYQLTPDDVIMAQLFPPQDQFVNAMETCLHLWEIEG